MSIQLTILPKSKTQPMPEFLRVFEIETQEWKDLQNDT